MSDVSQSSSGSLPLSSSNVTPSIPVKTTQDYYAERGIAPSSSKLSVQTESLEETKARLEKEKAETDARIAKEKAEYEARIAKEKAEYEVRLRQEEHDKAFQRKKEYFAGLIVLVLLTFCVIIHTNSKSLAQEKEWSRTGMTAIISAVVGFVFAPRKTGS